MKLLLDTCVWGGARQPLEQDGHEVEWTGNWKKDPGDEEEGSQTGQGGTGKVEGMPDMGDPGAPA